MSVTNQTLLARAEVLAEARRLVRMAPEDGVARYVLGVELLGLGEREEGRRALVRAAELMTPAEALRFGRQATGALRDAGFADEADEAAAALEEKARGGHGAGGPRKGGAVDERHDARTAAAGLTRAARGYTKRRDG